MIEKLRILWVSLQTGLKFERRHRRDIKSRVSDLTLHRGIQPESCRERHFEMVGWEPYRLLEVVF